MPVDSDFVSRGRSLRLEMLQVARLARTVLGDSADLVRGFIRAQTDVNGAGLDRAGRADLYYTIFGLAAAEALQDETLPARAKLLAPWLESFGEGAELDFIHLGALARCWSAVGPVAPDFATSILARLETYRSRDGGYHENLGATHGHAYGCFVALGAYQDLGVELPEPLRMVQCLKMLETPEGAWGNVRGMKSGTVPATAAAVTLLHQFSLPVNDQVAQWLLGQQHEGGGWLAVPGAPVPDLLSTATALHALACLGCDLPSDARERALDFVDSLWNASGGFHGHWADDELDVEYTFYGLLALGHLA